jgi:uncharacterized protein (DUF58 family)
MDDSGPSLAKRALAAVVLVIVAIIALRIVIGVLSGIFWLLALAVLAVAAVWAYTTLKSVGRDRSARKEQRAVKPSSAPPMPLATHEDRVDAQMEEIREQLRRQGRL